MQLRQNSSAKRGGDGKCALCTHVYAPHPHTLEGLQSRVTKLTLNTPPSLEKTQQFFKFIFVQNPSIGQQLSQQANTTHLRWTCITATAANSFQLTFIQP